MGIDVLDHLILADQRYFSLIESGRCRRESERSRPARAHGHGDSANGGRTG